MPVLLLADERGQGMLFGLSLKPPADIQVSCQTGSGMQVVDYFASVVWLIMRGDAVAKEFLAALTDSQVSECHAQHTSRLFVDQWSHVQSSYCNHQISWTLSVDSPDQALRQTM